MNSAALRFTVSTSALASRLRLVVAGLLLTVGLAGCAGSVVVDIDTAMQVSGRDSTGRAWTASAPDVVTIPPSPGMVVAFGSQQYTGTDLTWTVSVGAFGLGGSVTNTGTTRLCLRFDEAMVSSNFHPTPVALRVFTFSSRSSDRQVWLGTTNPKQIEYFGPPPVCLLPGKSATVSMGPQVKQLFPNNTLFNLRWPRKIPELSEKGVGNSLQIDLPVERDGRREQMTIRLTAKDSRARLCNY